VFTDAGLQKKLIMVMITGSIACSAKRWHLNYPEADFEGFSPAGNMLHRWG